uniref:Uncharacterized protein n=1 Tax=Romanomermis culicivorax TaxID=13658 RepID=A0A915IWM1_ROMCU
MASNEELLQAGYNDGGDLKSRCLKVKNQMRDLVEMLENRRQLLQMALNFFRAADIALNRLDALNSEARSLSLSRQKQMIMKQHEELNRRVQEAARSALDQGRLLLEKSGRHAGSRGVE